MLPVDPSPQCEGVFAWYDFDKTRLNSMELFIVLANFTGAGKEDKLFFMKNKKNCNNSKMPIANILFSVVISLTLN